MGSRTVPLYRAVRIKKWDSVSLVKLDHLSFRVFDYCITSRETNLLGLFPVSFPVMAVRCACTLEELMKSLSTLEGGGRDSFIKIDREKGYILVINHFKHNPYAGPNMAGGMLNCIQELGYTELLQDLFWRGVRFQIMGQVLKAIYEKMELLRVPFPCKVSFKEYKNLHILAKILKFGDDLRPQNLDEIFSQGVYKGLLNPLDTPWEPFPKGSEGVTPQTDFEGQDLSESPDHPGNPLETLSDDLPFDDPKKRKSKSKSNSEMQTPSKGLRNPSATLPPSEEKKDIIISENKTTEKGTKNSPEGTPPREVTNCYGEVQEVDGLLLNAQKILGGRRPFNSKEESLVIALVEKHGAMPDDFAEAVRRFQRHSKGLTMNVFLLKEAIINIALERMENESNLAREYGRENPIKLAATARDEKGGAG